MAGQDEVDEERKEWLTLVVVEEMCGKVLGVLPSSDDSGRIELSSSTHPSSEFRNCLLIIWPSASATSTVSRSSQLSFLPSIKMEANAKALLARGT